MKLLVVAVALLVVCVNADEQCSELEKVKVKHQWYEAYGTGHARLLLGLRVWNKCVRVLLLLCSLLSSLLSCCPTREVFCFTRVLFFAIQTHTF